MSSTLVRRAPRLISRTSSPRLLLQTTKSHPRHFTRNHQLLLVSRQHLRPQLPYLYSNSRRSTRFQRHIARLLSTETRESIKETAITALKINIYGWGTIVALAIIYLAWMHETQEAKTPSPPDWSFWSKFYFAEAKLKQFPSQLQGRKEPDWVWVADCIRKVIDRIEDPEIDGAEIKSALGEGEGAILVEGVGKVGADISGKSEPWRRGYFEALMTAGAAAEQVDGYVHDTTRDTMAFPPDVVIGPSNPRPQPMPERRHILFNRAGPLGLQEAPKEENCVPFYPPPETFYMKVLTTAGFNNDQRTQAAVAYADWLSYKGLSSSAREMYEWAIDIASEAYTGDQKPPIDKQTGFLRSGADPVTSNLLMAATSLAVHFGQSGDFQSALPAFLSILQAQRSLPEYQAQPYPQHTVAAAVNWGILSSIIKERPYPPPPISGDLPATKTITSDCDEAGTLAHIGEIMFTLPGGALPDYLSDAKSKSQRKSKDAVEASPAEEAGLAWTVQAVDLAEQSLESLCGRDKALVILPGKKSPEKPTTAKDLNVSDEELQKAKESCATCLEMAVDNWVKMVEKLAKEEYNLIIARAEAKKAKKARAEGKGAEAITETEPVNQSSWWGVRKQASQDDPEKPVGKWLDESDQVVRERRLAARALLREERLPLKIL